MFRHIVDITSIPLLSQANSATSVPSTSEQSTPAIVPPDSPDYKKPGQKKPRPTIRIPPSTGDPIKRLRSSAALPPVDTTPPDEPGSPKTPSDTEDVITPSRSLRSRISNKRLATSPPQGNPSAKTSREDLSRDAAKSSRATTATTSRAPRPTEATAASSSSKVPEKENATQRNVANLFGLESGHPFLDLLPHFFAKPSLEDLGTAGELKCLSCVTSFAETCEAQGRIAEPTGADISRAAKNSLIPGVKSCRTCAAKHSAHCSQQKLAVLWGNMSESLRPPTLVSNQHVLSRLRHITSDWDEVHHAKHTLDRAVARYQHSVSEFAEELLVADEYFKSDPNFWTEIGLLSSAEAAEEMLDARAALSAPTGTSARDAAARLFALHATATVGLHDELRERPMDIPIPPALNWSDRHAPIAARFLAPETSKSKGSKKSSGGKGKAKSGGI
ncbi:hypothetical protein NP233_g10556 [Leucocoprinus birnbaumii]|uniref:Uncharacterized protein n=1 Tax=Leucocoprinus birnbaumii TaxID=56174 RepID=A0AAD5YRR7_9AGAR|nr:hypothetical protein NP233_g10556 [Leucocoprinus birnbaumii]